MQKNEEIKKHETWAYLGLGHAYRLNNQFQTAIEQYKEALKIAKERGDKQQETEAYIAVGQVYRLNNQFEITIEYFERALQITKKRAR